MTEEFKTLQVVRRDDVLFVRFDRPDQLNALDDQMSSELHEVFTAGAADPALRAVVLRGSGGNFMAGADLARLERWTHLDPPALAAELASGFQAELLTEVDIPVVAAVDGVAFGIGMDVALAADVLIVTERAVFALPETDVGVVPVGGASHWLPRQIGPARAARVALFGEKVTAAQAVECGLASKVVAADDLDSAVEEVLTRIRRRSAVAMRGAKRLLRRAASPPAEVSVAETAEFAQCLALPDVHEGIAAIRERRRPNFAPPARAIS